MKNLFVKDSSKLDDMEGDVSQSRAILEEVYNLCSATNPFARQKACDIINKMGISAAQGLLHATFTQLSFIKANKEAERMFKEMIINLIENNENVKKFYLKYGIANYFDSESKEYFMDIIKILVEKERIVIDDSDKSIFQQSKLEKSKLKNDQLFLISLMDDDASKFDVYLENMLQDLNNGDVESAVKTMKELVERGTDEEISECIDSFFSNIDDYDNLNGWDRGYQNLLERNAFKLKESNYKVVLTSLETSLSKNNLRGRNKYIEALFVSSVRMSLAKDKELLVDIDEFVIATNSMLNYWFQAISDFMKGKGDAIVNEYYSQVETENKRYLRKLFMEFYFLQKIDKSFSRPIQEHIEELIREYPDESILASNEVDKIKAANNKNGTGNVIPNNKPTGLKSTNHRFKE